MEKTFNCHANVSAVVSNGDETHILFLLNRPVMEGDKSVKMVMQEQALISIPFEYAAVLGEALLSNVKKHKAEREKQAGSQLYE